MRILLLLSFTFLCFPQYAFAKSDNTVSEKRRAEIQNLHPLLKNSINRKTHKEQYLNNLLRFLRANGDKQEVLSVEKLDQKKKQAILDVQKRKIFSIMKFAVNNIHGLFMNFI